ncbi:hypothetical protein EDB85DRAFT_2150506 [Lactarius pseudohatsudake]|nr:hypothetical protein EDB85DRAFT_2150506 [Lactarius pseudohatsudake]
MEQTYNVGKARGTYVTERARIFSTHLTSSYITTTPTVTIHPMARPERPLGTAVRRSQADYAEEEAQISRLVAEHAQAPRAKSPVGYYAYGSAQKSQEYWE